MGGGAAVNDVVSLLAGMPSDERVEVLRRARHFQTMGDGDADAALADLAPGQRERVRALMPLSHEVLRQAENDAQSAQER